MAPPIRLTHFQVLHALFDALDRRLARHVGASTVKGFWQSGMSTRLVPDKSPEALSVRDMGFWKATASTMYGQVEFLAAMLGGNVRVGILLPVALVERDYALKDSVSRLYNGQPAHIERQIGGLLFFDWVFKDAPFSAEWLARCSYKPVAHDILENHFLWMILHLWEGLARIIASSHNESFPVFGDTHIPAALAENCGITIMDRFAMQTKNGEKQVTLIKTESGDLPMAVMEKLRGEIPGCAFTMIQAEN